jgi:hypothetical protein
MTDEKIIQNFQSNEKKSPFTGTTNVINQDGKNQIPKIFIDLLVIINKRAAAVSSAETLD